MYDYIKKFEKKAKLNYDSKLEAAMVRLKRKVRKGLQLPTQNSG